VLRLGIAVLIGVFFVAACGEEDLDFPGSLPEATATPDATSTPGPTSTPTPTP